MITYNCVNKYNKTVKSGAFLVCKLPLNSAQNQLSKYHHFSGEELKSVESDNSCSEKQTVLA